MTASDTVRPFPRSPRTLRCFAAVAISVVVLGPFPSIVEASDRDTIRRLLEDGRYAEARQVAADNLERVRAEEGTETLAATQALDLWIEARLADGDRALELLELAGRAQALNEELLGTEDLRLAESLTNLALAQREIRGGPTGAREGFERALLRRRTHLGEDHPDTLRSAVLLANMLKDMGEFQEARALLERACAVAESAFGPESLELSRLLSVRGILLWRLDALGEARPDLERAVRIQERLLGNHPELALTINRLAILEWAEGEYVAARALYERQLEIQRMTLRPDHPDFGTTWLNMGLLLWSTGDLQGAKEMFDRSYALPAHQESPDHPGRGYQNYARLAVEMGDYGGALARLEKLKEVRERLLPPDDPLILRSYWDLGTLHRETGELGLARDYLLLAVSRSAAAYGAGHTRHAEVLHDLALLEERAGDLAAARRYLEHAVGIAEAAVGSTHPLTASLLGDLGRILLRQGRTSAALELSLEAAGLHRTHLTRMAQYFSERETLSAEAHRLSAIQVAYSVVARPGTGAEIAARVWDEITRGRALVLDAIASRHRAALELESSAAAALRHDLEGARRLLARLFVQGPGDGDVEEYLRRLRAAGEEKERLERRLADTGATSNMGSGNVQIGLDEVRAALPPGAALVAFSEYDDYTAPSPGLTPDQASMAPRPPRSYLGLVLAPESAEPAIVRIADADTLERAVDRWRAEAAARPRSGADVARYLESGRRLRAMAWDPIAARLGAAEEVYLVPDGAINLVSFATLPDEGDGYLVERLRFHYLSSERDLVPLALPRDPGVGLLALGGADFDAVRGAPATSVPPTPPLSDILPQPEVFRGIHSACENFQSLRFAPLPGSEAEALEVAELFRSPGATPAAGVSEPVTLLTGAAATEGSLKRSARGHRILHIATHGFMIDAACDSALPRSGAGLAPGGATVGTCGARVVTGGASRGTCTVIENPLLLSGIALTSANRRGQASPGREDGVLTAEEAASLDLRGVEWAVLSGCGTGLGPVQTGEGVLGLRRAFRVAGADTLIISLWPVEDHAARQWFRHLYEARLAGAPTPRAMQTASLEVLERRRAAATTTHPFYWGAFVAAGDWK